MSTFITTPELIDLISFTYHRSVEATGVLLPAIAIIGGGALLIWGIAEAVSRWQSHRLREARKPIIIP